jgi:hypothetical protein
MSAINASVMVEMRAPVLRLVCTKCGAAGSAGCNHGVEFLVKASDRALLEIQKNPGLSNRAIAAKAGVDKDTVRKINGLRSHGEKSPGERKSVIGKDGKRYKPRRRKPLPAKTVENSVDPLFLKISELAVQPEGWLDT